MKGLLIIGLLVLGLGVGATKAATPDPAIPYCSNLERQVKSLKAQRAKLRRKVTTLNAKVTTLNRKVTTLTTERDTARAERDAARAGVGTALATMPPEIIWSYFGTIANQFNTPKYSKSYFSSGDNYASWTFTWCGFC
jgi:hypothetical protein